MSLVELPELHATGPMPGAASFMQLAELDQAALDAIPVAVYICAGDGRVIRFNDKAVELWGRTPRLMDPAERFCGSFRLYRVDGTHLPHEDCPMATALETGESFHAVEVLVERPDGERRTVLANIAPLTDERGCVTGAINCLQDISARKLAEERQRYVANELNHRVKNLLATVHSMAAFTARDAVSLDDFSERFEARLMALSRTQKLLSQCEHAGANLRDLLEKQLEPFGGGESSRVRLEGRDVHLEAPEAMSICLAFHELMTNAAKYGALSVGQGQVTVEWEVKGDARDGRLLTLHWSETDGPAVAPPTRAGFGTKLICRTIASLHGESDLAFDPAGLRFTASIPLAADPAKLREPAAV